MLKNERMMLMFHTIINTMKYFGIVALPFLLFFVIPWAIKDARFRKQITVVKG